MDVTPLQIFVACIGARYIGKYLCEHVDGLTATLLVYQQSQWTWLGRDFSYMVTREDDDDRYITMTRNGTKVYALNPLFSINADSPEEAINRSGHWRVLRGESQQ